MFATPSAANSTTRARWTSRCAAVRETDNASRTSRCDSVTINTSAALVMTHTHEQTKLKSLKFDLLLRFADIGNSGVSLKVALDSKVAKKKAEQEPIELRVARVAQTLQNRLPFDGAEAAKEIAKAYSVNTRDLLAVTGADTWYFDIAGLTRPGAGVSRRRHQGESGWNSREVDVSGNPTVRLFCVPGKDPGGS